MSFCVVFSNVITAVNKFTDFYHFHRDYYWQRCLHHTLKNNNNSIFSELINKGTDKKERRKHKNFYVRKGSKIRRKGLAKTLLPWLSIC